MIDNKLVHESFRMQSDTSGFTTASKWPRIAALLVALALFFVVGLLIGHFCIDKSTPSPTGTETFVRYEAQESDTNDKLKQKRIGASAARKLLFDAMDNLRIKATHKDLSSRTSLSGTPQDYELANKMKSMWQDAGLDTVRVQDYDVQLGYPNASKPNRVSLVAANGTVVFETAIRESARAEGDPTDDFVQPYLIYAKPGVVTADPVFVNYCGLNDFLELVRLNVSVSGKIALCTYGKVGRARKIHFATRFGAVAVVIMHDPRDDAPLGTGDLHVYNYTEYLPSDGVERGSTALKMGDPDTPFLPSRPYAYRASPEELKGVMPGIPAQPISYGDALQIMRLLGNQPMPANWTFGNTASNSSTSPFQIGPGLRDASVTMRVQVYNSIEVRTIYNVIGLIEGWEEPDRYVIIGNHKDAWVLGAVDAKTGTATVTEIVRAFGALTKTGWRPRRTLVFALWSGEEQGLIGSTEFNDEFRRQLEANGVMYLNIDIACMGQYLMLNGGSPLIRALALDAARNTPNPSLEQVAAGYATIYDVWLSRSNETLAEGTLPVPAFRRKDGGSDFAPFAFLPGLPFFDLSYYSDTLAMYPAYHSLYDTHYLVASFYDPEFKYHQAVARIGAWMLHRAADDPILPFGYLHYSTEVRMAMLRLTSTYRNFTAAYPQFVEAFDHLRRSVTTFSGLALSYEYYLSKLKSSNTLSPLERRQINDNLKNFERNFILTKSHLGSTHMFSSGGSDMHTILQPTSFNSGKYVFAPLADALYLFRNHVTSRAANRTSVSEYHGLQITKDDVLRYFALTTYTLESASRSLRLDQVDKITH